MSLDYYVWKGPKLTAAEVGQRLLDLDNLGLDEASLFDWSTRLPMYRTAVLARFPPLEDLTDDDLPDNPWAMTPVESTRFMELNLRWSVSEEQLKFILGRALFHGLYIYDPQADEVYAPGPARWQIWLRKLGLGRFAGPDP